MILLPYPSIFARKALQARTLLQTKLKEWYNAGHFEDDDVSALTKARMNTNSKHGISGDELGADLIGSLFVSTTNAIPTLYWFFLYVFSSPSLTREIRAEVETVTRKGTGKQMIIDHTKFPTECPLLCSAYQEVLRLTNIQGSTRYATQDTILTSSLDDNRERKEYLIKKGTLVMTPGSITHLAPSVWGSDALVYDPRRFLDLGKGDKNLEKARKKSFIPFGGGKHLCPGRHFAFAEILGLVAILVMGFDIEDKNGGNVKLPKGIRFFANATLKPDDNGLKAGFRIRRKKGLEETQWAFVEA